MFNSMKSKRSIVAATMLATCSLTIASSAAFAEDASLITLYSYDGTVVLTGEFLKFDDGFYFLVVPHMGLISVAMEGVECRSTQLVCADLVSNS